MKQTPKRACRRDEEHASAVFLTELATGLLSYAPGLILPFCVEWSGQILRAVTCAGCMHVACSMLQVPFSATRRKRV